MTSGGGGWIDRVISACVGLLIASFALYCAVSLIESIMPTLIVIIGIAALVGVAIGAVVAFRTWRDRW